MIDHIVGRPNPSWKRKQVFLVLVFWIVRIVYGGKVPPRTLWLRPTNRALSRFSPWQIIVSTLTAVYALRNLDKILGLGAPEPLAHLYSPSYYRATWIATGLDAGFGTAMSIRPKWLRDICSIMFSVYYIIYANEADEKLRKFRAVPTVEMLRTTWEKTSNPYIRFATWLPKVAVRRKLTLTRPVSSMYKLPITAYLFFAPAERHLSQSTDLILDFPGGGFIAMSPEHHEDRLRMWAVRTGKPVLAIDYGKAPEYPYPYAIDEAFDIYQALVESVGKIIGMSGRKLNIIMSGDSAGASIAVCVMIKLLESQGHNLQRPSALVLNYAALDFNFSSWMNPENMRLLQSEGSTGYIPGLAERNHYNHISPLSMVGDRKSLKRHRSWKDTLRNLTSVSPTIGTTLRSRRSNPSISKATSAGQPRVRIRSKTHTSGGKPAFAASEDFTATKEEDLPIQARVKFDDQAVAGSRENSSANVGTRLTMTSRTGYFQDRIISPSMMRAMAIMYIGPLRNPDFATDYHVSPILAPWELLAQFPPLLMQCGERDPFMDDTLVFAGRVREAKRKRKAELERELREEVVDSLRMTKDKFGDERLRREYDRLSRESPDDWVEMEIFSDWSHGYLQMPMLMSEARDVINDLADWISDTFAAECLGGQTKAVAVPSFFVDSHSGISSDSEMEADEHITFSPRRTVTSPLSSGETLQEVPQMEEQGRGSAQLTGSAGGKGKGRLTITESEVMRRRRMLDSHVFTGSS